MIVRNEEGKLLLLSKGADRFVFSNIALQLVKLFRYAVYFCKKTATTVAN